MKNIKIVIIVTCIITVALTLLLPFLIDILYYINPPFEFFNVSYENKDILSYYGGALSFIGSVLLGVITIIQNQKAQDKSDEVSRLKLELQRKSMAMAEERYEKLHSIEKISPKFEIKISGYNGTYANIKLEMKNVSSTIVSSISPLAFYALDENSSEIDRAKDIKVKNTSLSSAQSTQIETIFQELIIRTQEKYHKNISCYNNISLIFEFSCEDEKGETHYYRSELNVPTTQKFTSNVWKTTKVG